MKTVLITAIDIAEDRVKDIIMKLQHYGVIVKGHFWEDDIKKMSWSAPRSELINIETAMWLILVSIENLSKPTIRYGLSLLTLMVQAQRGISFPAGIIITQGDIPSADSLPTALRSNDLFLLSDATLYPKIIARLHTPVKEVKTDYFLDVYANPHIGLLFEIGPRNTKWHGAMFGVSDAKITHHAVGAKGKLPEKAVLNYPVEGMRINLGEKEFLTWAVQNDIDDKTSYFLKIEGEPDSILFGPYSDEEEAEAYVITIK